MKPKLALKRASHLALGLSILLGTATPAANAAAAAPTTRSAAADVPPLKQEELEQILAPIALYPDSLLSQILMASTYPLEVVQADRFAQASKDLKGEALTKALEAKPWDASVKSLVAFPTVLTMMSEKLDITVKIGDAFIAQEKQVLDTVQVLRAKAQSTGNLKTTPEQKVVVETVKVEQAEKQVIVIQPASPEVVYVPSYSPTVVYGAWPYPAYPPAPYYPPGYVAGQALAFAGGVAVGAAWGYAWGNCNWGGGNVDIDVDRNTNINNNIDRSKVKNEMSKRSTNLQNGKGSFQHDPAHRQGVSYRDQGTANKFGGGARSSEAAKARESYRGRAETGRQDLARDGAGGRGGADAGRGGAGAAGGGRGGPSPSQGGVDSGRGGAAGNRPTANDRSAGGRDSSPNRSSPSASDRSSSPSRGGAVEGANRGGSAARQESARGSSSRSAPSRSAPSRSSGGGGGGSRGGGGGSRGGGGGRR